jgi:hypothetical protein
MEEISNAHRILMGKPLGKRSLHLEDLEGDVGYIKVNSSEIRCEDGRWMELAEDHVQWWALVFAVLK